MGLESLRDSVHQSEARLVDFLDAGEGIVIPDGVTLISHLDRNTRELGEAPAYRFLDFSREDEGATTELTWAELGQRVRAVAGRLQQVTTPRERVAILAPQCLDYVVGFFAAIQAGCIAVPLFAPELAGQAERLESVIADSTPAVIVTTSHVAASITAFFRKRPRRLRPRILAIDAVPDVVGELFNPVHLSTDDIAYLQYTSGSTRVPAGVEITHRAVCTNVAQMILAGGLDTDIRSVSWLPLHHDMGLVMIMFPALCGGHITLMSPQAFVRRPHRWIKALAEEGSHGRTFAAAPNFAFSLAAQRGLPAADEALDLSNVAGLLNGSEPVTLEAIDEFVAAFAPYGLARSAIKPSYGMAEATLSVASIAPGAEPTALWLDREAMSVNRAVPVDSGSPNGVAHVSCGQIVRSQWGVIVDPERGTELADGCIGEIWLHGNNIGGGYWGRERQTEVTFRNKLQTRLGHGSHADGAPRDGSWLRTGDLGAYIGGELYITGRMKDLIIIDGRNHYPQDIEATVSECSRIVRSGYVAAFAVPSDALSGQNTRGRGERVVIVAERAAGAGRGDHAPVVAEITAAVARHHAVAVADVRIVAAGSLHRTTSGKLARHACRAAYLAAMQPEQGHNAVRYGEVDPTPQSRSDR